MPRELDPISLSGMMSERASTIQVQAAVIEHAASSTIFRVVRNTEDIIHDGETYTAVGFNFTPPEESESGFANAQITFNDVEQWLTPTVRSLSGDIRVTVYHLGASDLSASPPVFDIVDMVLPSMLLKKVEIDETVIACDLVFDGEDDQNVPCDLFSPSRFPGLFSRNGQ